MYLKIFAAKVSSNSSEAESTARKLFPSFKTIDDLKLVALLGVTYVAILQLERRISKLGGAFEPFAEVDWSVVTHQQLENSEAHGHALEAFYERLKMGNAATSTIQ
jgi:hypothetical protein